MTDTLELATEHYRAGKAAFERGHYRQAVQQLERACALVDRHTRLGGEMQIWLVTAYEAVGQGEEAIALCNRLNQHSDLDTRKQSRGLLAILEAPKLVTRPEWLTQIPDLATLDVDKTSTAYAPPKTTRKPAKRTGYEPEVVDWSQVNTRDNRFTWVAMGLVVLLLGGLVWWGGWL